MQTVRGSPTRAKNKYKILTRKSLFHYKIFSFVSGVIQLSDPIPSPYYLVKVICSVEDQLGELPMIWLWKYIEKKLNTILFQIGKEWGNTFSHKKRHQYWISLQNCFRVFIICCLISSLPWLRQIFPNRIFHPLFKAIWNFREKEFHKVTYVRMYIRLCDK